jgi:isopenicillin N synthase-like dioxygenase
VHLNHPDDLVVNIGDALSSMTNNTFKSMRHRVVKYGTEQRQSIAYFVNFNVKALIEPTCKFSKSQGNYLPVTSGDYIMHKSGLAMRYPQSI